jgi:Fe-S-cluster-containing hydrogenase component 2
MKISIFYFSGTGNTWWICQEFMKIALNSNHDVKLYSIENLEKFEPYRIISESDILGIAYPTYGSDIPKIMKSFIQRIVAEIKEKPLNNKPSIMVLVSEMIFSGDGALVPRKYFHDISLPLKWGKNFALSSNISVPGFRANPADEKTLLKRKERAQHKLLKLIAKIEKNKEDKRPQLGIIGRFLGWIQRVFLDVTIKSLLKLSIDPKLCIKCMKCVNQCPVQNIIYDDESEIFTYLDKCIWCMRCFNFCPTHAILVNGRYCDPKKFKRMKPISKEYTIK